MCDTVVVVRPEGVLFAKNSDRDPNEAQPLDWQPARTYGPGSRVRCTWIEIAQVEHTFAVLLSRPYWMWGAEMGTNEHGVTIGNEAVFTREPYRAVGLTGMDLLRLALERAANAKAAVEVIVELIAAHGQGGGAGHENRQFTYHNSFIIADPRSAYVLETAGGHTAVEAVLGARSISNGLTIEDFAARHGAPLYTWASRGRRRRARTEAAANQAEDAGALMRLLRDHHRPERPEAPEYSLLFGGMHQVCMHGGGVVAASQTTASWVSDLRPGQVRHFATATAAPCTALFKPVAVAVPLDLGAPADHADSQSLWWRHERLHRQILRAPEQLLPQLSPERDALEQRWLQQAVAPAEAFAEGERWLARATESLGQAAVRDERPWWARRYWETRNRRAGLVPDAR